MTFAVGAFLSPFLTSCYISAGLGWRAVAYTVVTGSSFAWLFYAMMKIDYNYAEKKRDTEKVKEVYYKNPIFYIMGFLLFLYLGLENCVNGWFVTYFKSMGIMSDAYATNLVSVTWVMVMLGRLLTAKLSTKIHKNKLIFSYCVATAVFFLLLIATKNLVVITAAIAGLGFFFAGIYPTSVSSVGKILKGSTTGMSMLLAMAALGGIVTPQIVGIAADGFGMAAAILLLGINAAGMLILSLVNMKINKE
jgi:fucose permease